MPEANAYPLLFSPLQVGPWRLKNRIVHASMSLRYGAAKGMHPSYHQYYLNRARGGAALIITDPVAFLPSQGSERLCAWNDSMVDDLSRFSQAIRSEDCHLLASPHPRLPLKRYFFYPGFTEKTGGLIREAHLINERSCFQSHPQHALNFLTQQVNSTSIAKMPYAQRISLFCYPYIDIFQVRFNLCFDLYLYSADNFVLNFSL
jgi:hypothetical protein